jgi:hypothetical protein
MRDETTKQAAQEFLAAKLAEEGQKHEDKLNRETAEARSLHVWRNFRDAVFAQCSEWNAVTQAQTLTCTETPMGDLRIWCSATAKQMTVYYDSRKLFITVRNGARLEVEKDAILLIKGYSTDSGRDAHLVRNNETVNTEALILGELRLLAGIGRQRLS